MVKLGTRQEYDKIIGKRIFTIKDCPFCTKLSEHKKQILWKGKHWFLMHNMFPYSGNEKHIMAIPYSHKKFYDELTDEELLDFKNVNKYVKEFFGDQDYFSCLRETIANRSVEHLHYHFIPGRLKGKYLRKMLMDQGFPVEEKID